MPNIIAIWVVFLPERRWRIDAVILENKQQTYQKLFIQEQYQECGEIFFLVRSVLGVSKQTRHEN